MRPSLAFAVVALCFLGSLDGLGVPNTPNSSAVYVLTPEHYIKKRMYGLYPTGQTFIPFIPGAPDNSKANSYFPLFPMSAEEALSLNWTVYNGGVCVPRKGIPYLPPDSILYHDPVTGENLNPYAVYYDSNGWLNSVQIYLNYSTCCDNFVCGCESARAAFPVQRYYATKPFIPFDPITCPTCVPVAATLQTNNRNAAFPGMENVDHHFVYFAFRDPDVVCAANTTEFFADRTLYGFAIPNTTFFLWVDGFVYFAMYFNPTPRGYFDTQSCIPFMGVHMTTWPTPPEFGAFAVYGMYNHFDETKKNLGVDLLFTGRNQNNPYLENFVRFINNPEPCSSLHVWFGDFLEIQSVCPLDPADPNSPVYPLFSKYRPISGNGNNKDHPTWGAEGRPYTNRVQTAQVRGYAFDYHAHWGNDSSWKGYLDICNAVTRQLGMGYIDGGGARATPSFLHIWTFGDPVYFCKNLLTNLAHDPAFSFLDPAIIAQAPVLPQPREISNQLFSRSPLRTERFTNDMHTYWAFFIVLDTAFTARDPTEMGLYFYPQCDGHRDTKCQCCSAPMSNPGYCLFTLTECWVFAGRLVDTAWLTDFQFPPFEETSNDNPRRPWSENTHYLDLSQVYGTSTTTMMLRDSKDPAYMALGQQVTIYPFYQGTQLKRGDLYGTQWDFRGDFRANKSPPMKVLTDTFLHNHNRLVGLLEEGAKASNQSRYNDPAFGRVYLFEDARRLNIAYYQKIVFREYMGALLGRPLNPYDTNADGLASTRSGVETYDPNVNPSLDITWVQLAYRYAHTELNSNLHRLDSNFDASVHPDVLLRESWFNITTVNEYATAPEDFLRGLVTSRQAEAGAWASEDVRNYMFNDWNMGSDLMATDIYRGRDVGLPTFNDIRKYYNLAPYEKCSDISTDAHAIEIVYSLYGPDPDCINRIDPFVAGFLEPKMPQSPLGETFWHLNFDQFTRLRNGDRFYFENLNPETNPNPLNSVELAMVYSNTLEQTFVDNWADIQLGQLGSGIFFLRQRQLQTLAINGNVNSLNFLAYTPPEFEFAQFQRLSPTYGLWYYIDGDELTVRYQTASLGWVGLGIEPDLNTMKNADIYFCRLWPNLTAEITDRYALDVGPPALDISIGGEDNILEFSVEHIDGNTICQFTRKVDTGDKWDKVILGGQTKLMFAFNPETTDLVYHGPTRQSNFYFDFYETYPVDEVSVAIVIVYGVLGGLGVLFALFIILSIAKQEEYFKFMSPLFCQLLCFGAMICISSVFPLMQQPPTHHACYAYPWLLGIGFSVMFGGLFSKTWRLWRLFSTKSLKAQVITNGTVLIGVAMFVIPMVIFLIIWSSVDGFVVQQQFSPSVDGAVRFVCYTPRAWWPIFAAMVALVLVLGCIITFLIRNLPPEFNDAEPIGFSMYNALMMFVAGTAIGWGLSDYVDAIVAAQGFPVIFMVWFTLVVLFVPTLWRMWVTKKEPQSFQSSMAMRSGGSNVSGLNTSTAADS